MAQAIFKKLFRRTPTTRFLFFFVSDIVLIIFSVWLAFFLRFEGNIESQFIPAMERVIILALVFSLPLFYFFRLYSFTWAYVGTNELIALFKAVILSFFLAGGAIYFSEEYRSFFGFPRSTLIFSYILIFFFTGGIRLSKRIYHEISLGRDTQGKERTLIVGAGDEGEQILRSILQTPHSPYFPVGFVDSNPFKRGNLIHGVKVLGGIGDIGRLAKECQIETLIIALPNGRSAEIREAVKQGREAGLKNIKIIPSLSSIIGGKISLQNLRDVQVEDLLGREQIALDEKGIENFLKGKVVLLTGAAGSIGSELARQIARFSPSRLVLVDQDETGMFILLEELRQQFPKFPYTFFLGDIQDKKKMAFIFQAYRPAVVFHAAAYKHVPLMEVHGDEAVKNNIFGTLNIASLSEEHGVETFVFISTDKAVNPVSVMGATKRVGEMICQALNQKNNTRFISVRFGNVLDSRGSVIQIFREQIKKGGPVTITHPAMQRFFMSTPEACLLVLQAGAMGEGGEVFVLDMGEPIRIEDLAREMIRLSGFEPDKDIPIVFTGTRPGEKFAEDPLSAHEGTVATKHEKIFITKLPPIDEDTFFQELEKLKEVAQNPNQEEIRVLLQKLVPSYRPSRTNDVAL